MDQTLLNLFKIVANKNNVSEDTVKRIVNYSFNEVRKTISTFSNQDILLNEFIRFKTSPYLAKRYLEQVNKKNDKGLMGKERYEAITSKLKEIINGKEDK